MRQMTEHDAAFLYADSASRTSTVTLVHIYDQSTAPGGKIRFKDILAHVDNRLHRLPNFRQKLLHVPLDMDLPYWVDDEHFSLEYHVRHIALPKPGDWRQFCIQASRIHARALDVSRPLWEMYVIEGLDSFLDLPPGSFAVLLKIHQSAIDFEHGNEITTLLHDPSPRPQKPDPQLPWLPEPPPPTTTLLVNSLINSLLAPFRLTKPAGQLARLVPDIRNFIGASSASLYASPMTRFNAVVSPHRVFDTRRFSLAEFKAIRTMVEGATVNDVVLAVCGGGLRRYLELQGELPATTLSAAAPLSVRDEKGGSVEAPRYTWDIVRLHTEIDDPIERLIAIHADTSASTNIARAVSARELTNILQHAPPTTIALTSKMLAHATAQQGLWAPLANCSLTNVPGPTVPLYLRGARMTYFSAILPISDGMGLAYAVTSYDQKVVVSFTACYEQLPDPEVFAQCIRDSFQEYLARVNSGKRQSASAAANAVRKKRGESKRRSSAQRTA
jgi:WS/DGAT/MGAT family acyltransferase